MNLFIRAHDLGVVGLQNVIDKLNEYGLDGVQMVAYKCLDDVKYTANGITQTKAEEIAKAFADNNKKIAMIGAYFNPVHSNKEKVATCKQIFKDYLAVSNAMGKNLVGSETGSFNDDKWTYHPRNRTDEALDTVVATFTELAEYAQSVDAEIAMEGAFGHCCYNVDTLKKAVDRINMPNIKIIFDLYNYLDISNINERNEILLDGLQTFGTRIEIFHIKDCIVDNGAVKQVAVGKGCFDYDFILSEIYKVNKNANLVFEGTTGQDIETSVKFIKEKIKKIEVIK